MTDTEIPAEKTGTAAHETTFLAGEVFWAELNLIGDKQMRRFALEAFERVDPRFGSLSSSSSGLHHSGQQNGTGGLVRHTRAVVYMARRLAKAYRIGDGDDLDLVTLGALLHDVGKPLERKNGGPSPLKHDELGAELVYQLALELDFPHRDSIKEMIGRHMGIWGTTPCPVEEMGVHAQVVHLADYTVSQKGLSFEPIDRLNEARPGSLG